MADDYDGLADLVEKAVDVSERLEDLMLQLDRMLRPFGSSGATPLAEQLERWPVLEDEPDA